MIPESDWPEKALLASPRGFCAGVDRAILSLKLFHQANQERQPGTPTYAYHQIIHNKPVVEEFERSGVIFVDDLTQIPERANVMYSAHGVSPLIRQQAHEMGLNAVDVTCPLVESPHTRARRLAMQGYHMVYIGHEGHDEAVGVMGEAPEKMVLVQKIEDVEKVDVEDPKKVAYLTQTTLSQDDTRSIEEALKARYPGIIGPPKSDICYATLNRQKGVKAIVAEGAEDIVVIGSQNSSNSKRLAEVALASGARAAYLIDEASELNPDWFIRISCVGLTSGASAPEENFQGVVSWFRERGTRDFIEVAAVNEANRRFVLPGNLTQ